jgi:DNA modification methylase
MNESMRLPDQIELIPLDRLIPYARNARTHSDSQVAQLAAAIREFGWTNPVLVDQDAGIIAGHGRVLAAQRLGMAHVPCIRLAHLTEAQKRALVLADNKIAENAGWDQQLLADELQALSEMNFDLGFTGFGEQEIAELLAQAKPSESGRDPDEAPAVNTAAAPTTLLGDVWLLGSHRLMCGDSTRPEQMRRLVADEKVDCVWTDPPYNVAYGDKADTLNSNRNTSAILNDDMDDAKFREFLLGFYRVAEDVMRPGASIYVAHAETERDNFTSAFLEAGFKLSGVVIWRKNTLVLGRSDYQWIHEPILYGWKQGASHRWYGGRKQVTVQEYGDSSPFVQRADGRWQIALGDWILVVDGAAHVEEVLPSVLREEKPRRNDVHPTMKPVALIERMLRNSARRGAKVLDPFGGSGSTLIACERLGMCTRLMELSPNYCDVIIRRWQEYTGNVATLEVDGRWFADVEAARKP